ncbi:expressed unknown protein [Seminavis robusta]|uniref:Uncharacterized protein n=1 Tax=Seminavis robusta TaxID=568900 RepID=A0A9N8DPR0_9STRA|nr:expressed unknown protein [Seminavis robusta]|eukprot:Sro173_g076300.1 n/a (360) ;mRNA; f:41455-42534
MSSLAVLPAGSRKRSPSKPPFIGQLATKAKQVDTPQTLQQPEQKVAKKRQQADFLEWIAYYSAVEVYHQQQQLQQQQSQQHKKKTQQNKHQQQEVHLSNPNAARKLYFTTLPSSEVASARYCIGLNVLVSVGDYSSNATIHESDVPTKLVLATVKSVGKILGEVCYKVQLQQGDPNSHGNVYLEEDLRFASNTVVSYRELPALVKEVSDIDDESYTIKLLNQDDNKRNVVTTVSALDLSCRKPPQVVKQKKAKARKAVQGVKNTQRSLFRRMFRGHGIRNLTHASQKLQTYAQQLDGDHRHLVSGLCLPFHLEAYCARGNACCCSESHQDLTEQQAWLLEHCLCPGADPYPATATNSLC